MEDKVVLLGAWRSFYLIRVKIVLAEKGVEYEYKEENLADKSVLLLQINPVYEKISVLVQNGKPICEFLIIVEYIDEVWNHKSPLLPSDPYKRVQVRFWVDYIDEKVEKQELAKKEFIEGLKTMEGELGDKAYFGGETIGFVDVALVPISCWSCALETWGNSSVEVECSKLIASVERCMERESVPKSPPNLHKF